MLWLALMVLAEPPSLAQAHALFLEARFEESLVTARAAIERTTEPKERAQLLLLSGALLEISGSPQQAVLAFQEAITLDPLAHWDEVEFGPTTNALFLCTKAAVRAGLDVRAFKDGYLNAGVCPVSEVLRPESVLGHEATPEAPAIISFPVETAAPESESVVGTVLLVSGVTSVLTGVVFASLAFSASQDLDASVSAGRPLQDRLILAGRIEDRALVADITIGAGLLLSAGAWWVLSSGER